MKVCVDASLVIKWLIPEEDSELALDLLEKWRLDRVALFAPSLLDYEVGTVLRQKVIRGFLAAADVYPVIENYRRLDILLFHLADLAFKAVAVAETLKQSSVYDVSYLLIARQQGANFVTADKKFYDAASPYFSEAKFFRDVV